MATNDIKIPGLISIEENEGSIEFILDDDKINEFYDFFGLEIGDDENLQAIVEEALQLLLNQEKENDTREG
jgi:hypothetical protein